MAETIRTIEELDLNAPDELLDMQLYLRYNFELIKDILEMGSDFFFNIVDGKVPGYSPLNVVAHDSEITTTLGTVGHQNGLLHEYSATADIDSISSSDVGDTHEITITGLDADLNEVDPFVVALDGQNRVAFPTSLRRIQCVRNNTGTITLGVVYVYVNTAIVAGVPTDTAKVRSSIHRITPPTGAEVSNERCANSVKTIPAGFTGFVVFGKTTVSDNKALELTFWIRPENGVFTLAHHIDIKDNNYDYFFKLPGIVPEKADLEIRAYVDVGTAEVAANYDLVLKEIAA